MAGRQEASGRLTPRRMLRLLGEVAGILRGGREPREALIGVAELLVPDVATRATVYAVDRDGRLHGLGSAGIEPDSPERERSLADGDRHPVALACREGRVCWRSADDGASGGKAGVPEPGTEVGEIAIPIQRARETVGVLDLRVDPERDAPWSADDVELLSHLSDELALGLDSLRLRGEVEAARRAKADFLAVMSHELRTPLTAVVGYADLLAAGITGPVAPAQTKQLERIKESAWELLALIDGILGFARHEGDDVDLLVSVVEPARIVEEALEAVRSELAEKGLELDVEIEDDLPALRTDRGRAVDILRHLLANAAKFTEDGRVGVEVSSKGDWIAFAVSDTGPGIAEDVRDRIFEPFWQGERAETRTRGGTGLGLAMVRRFADLLSAEIDVESDEGRGSTFTVRLPREGPHPTFP